MAETETPVEKIARLMRAPLKKMSKGDAINSVGHLIDLATDLRDDAAITRAFVQLRSVERFDLTPAGLALLHYFRANAWHGRRLIRTQPGPRAWEQPERQEQILELFRARNHDGFAGLPKERRCQILTNLGLQFLEVGRFIEAIEFWDEALGLIPNFSMALGSRGTGFRYYGIGCGDHHDRAVLLMTAQRSFAASIAPDAHWDSEYPDWVAATFATGAQKIAEAFDIDAIEEYFSPDTGSLGRSAEEQDYRRWCLRHRLFLNPLNDVTDRSIAASDPLMLPGIVVGFEVEGVPPVIGFFNQMKQEYAHARLLLFESRSEDRTHYADRRVHLHNTFDYPSYSIYAERARTAFRLAYGLLDKIGYFINHYWNLGSEAHRVGFRSVWYAESEVARGLHPRFHGYENWPLVGLFWLAKDLFDEQFQRVTNPDAREIFILRNSLEHKYLQLHDEWGAGQDAISSGAFGLSINRYAFEVKALCVLKMARAALIYLVLAVRREEQLRRAANEEPLISMEMPLSRFEDRWKR